MKFNEIYKLELGLDDERSYKETYGSLHLKTYEIFLQFLSRPSIVLDIGTGSGYGAELIAKSGHIVYGVDYDQKAILYCNNAYHGDELLHFDCWTVPPLPYQDGLFDYVVSIDNFEHIPPEQAELYVSEVSRVLAKDGHFFIATPVRCSERAIKYHRKHWNMEEFRTLLNKYFVEGNFEQIGIYLVALVKK